MADLPSIAVLITATGAALVSVIHSIQDSRCTSIRTCCVQCERTVREEPPGLESVPVLAPSRCDVLPCACVGL
jgi:hypothetical protein